jgi:hypothetical protein
MKEVTRNLEGKNNSAGDSFLITTHRRCRQNSGKKGREDSFSYQS